MNIVKIMMKIVPVHQLYVQIVFIVTVNCRLKYFKPNICYEFLKNFLTKDSRTYAGGGDRS
jgi:hypothetical protein